MERKKILSGCAKRKLQELRDEKLNHELTKTPKFSKFLSKINDSVSSGDVHHEFNERIPVMTKSFHPKMRRANKYIVVQARVLIISNP